MVPAGEVVATVVFVELVFAPDVVVVRSRIEVRMMGEAPVDELFAEIVIVPEGKASQQRRAMVAQFNDKILLLVLAHESVRVPVFKRSVKVVGGNEAPSAHEMLGRDRQLTISFRHVEEELPVRMPPAAPLLNLCRHIVPWDGGVIGSVVPWGGGDVGSSCWRAGGWQSGALIIDVSRP